VFEWYSYGGLVEGKGVVFMPLLSSGCVCMYVYMGVEGYTEICMYVCVI